MSNIEMLIEDLTMAGRSSRTAATYAGCIRIFERTCGVPLAQVTRQDVAKFLGDLAQGRRLAPPTVKNFVFALRFFYIHTVRRPEVVEGLRSPRITPKVAVVLSVDEVNRLLECIRSTTMYTFASLLYGTGMRIGEALAVTVDDIDAARGVIVVRHTKTRRPRIVRMSTELLSRLRADWRARRPPRPLLFPGLHGSRPLDQSTIGRALRRAAEEAGITKRVTPHVLRHTYATHLIEGGVDLHTVQLLLGHASLFETLRYLHLSNAHLAGRSTVMSPLLGEVPPSVAITTMLGQASRAEHTYVRPPTRREIAHARPATACQLAFF